MEKQQITLCGLTRNTPAWAAIDLRQQVTIARANWLEPDIESKPKLPPELYDPEPLGNSWPIVNPANDPVALLWIVSVLNKITGSVLEFDSYPLATQVRNAVGKSPLNTLDTKAKSSTCEMRE